MTKTIEQLNAELAAAREAVMAAERANLEAKRQAELDERVAREEAKTRAIAESIAPHLQAVADAIAARGIAVRVSPFAIKVRDIDKEYPDSGIQISVYRETKSSRYSFRSQYTGRIMLMVGDRFDSLGGARRYPLTKKGWSAAKIADEVAGRIDMQARMKKAVTDLEAAKATANALAARVRADLGMSPNASMITGVNGRRDGNTWREFVAPAGTVYVNVGQVAVSPENAAKLVALLQSFKAIN